MKDAKPQYLENIFYRKILKCRTSRHVKPHNIEQVTMYNIAWSNSLITSGIPTSETLHRGHYASAATYVIVWWRTVLPPM